MATLNDLTGQRFGRLLVTGRAANVGRKTAWHCRCDCGREILLKDSYKLTSGKTKSCRCINAERFTKANTTHGGVGTREYRAWAAAKQRCFQPSHKAWDRYGGRGITMYSGWRYDFPAFLAHIGPCPKGYTLDRRDTNGHYEPGNVRWATHRQQGSNTSRNTFYEFNGRRMHHCDWARELGINQASLRERIDKWGLERALTEPRRR